MQYNKFEFNETQYGPYPATVSNDRVTDEHAPVTVLATGDPLLNTPNKITDAAWNGWVQERGLYFLDADHDSRYQELLQIEDPFPSNKGAKKGALVAATVRQRPVGVRRPRALARTAGRRGRGLPAAREPDQPGQANHAAPAPAPPRAPGR